MSDFEVIEGGLGGGGEGSRSPHPRRRKQKNKAGLKKKSKSGQRKAALFCLNNYNKTAIFSDMLKELEWEMKKQQASCGDKHKEI